MYLDKLEYIIYRWNGLASLNNPSIKEIKLHKDHNDYVDSNPYFLTIERDNVILFRKGFTFIDYKEENPFEALAESLLDDISFAGFSRIIDLYNTDKLLPTKYKEDGE